MRALVKLLVLVVLVGVVVVGAAGYMGVVQVPLVSSLAGMDKAPDLGAAPADVAGHAAFEQAHGITFTSPAENYTFASKHTYSGSFAFSGTLTEGQVLAIREFGNPAPGIRDVTVRFHDGSAEAGAFMDLAPYGYPVSGPVRAAFTLAATGPRSVAVGITSLQFGRLGVPADIAAKAQDAINSYLATRLATIDGLRIDSLALREGAVSFAGTLPKTYAADAPKAGDLP